MVHKTHLPLHQWALPNVDITLLTHRPCGIVELLSSKLNHKKVSKEHSGNSLLIQRGKLFLLPDLQSEKHFVGDFAK